MLVGSQNFGFPKFSQKVLARIPKSERVGSFLKHRIMAKSSMTSKASARIQSATAKGNGGKVSPGSFASRAQSAAAKSGK